MAGYSTVSRSGDPQPQPLRQRADELLGADARGDLGDGHLDAEPTVQPAPHGRSQLGRADARRVAPFAVRRRERAHDSGGRRVARRADRQVHQPTGLRRGELGQRAETVVRVGRRDEAPRARRPFGSPRAGAARARRPFGSPRAGAARARRPFGSPRAGAARTRRPFGSPRAGAARARRAARVRRPGAAGHQPAGVVAGSGRTPSPTTNSANRPAEGRLRRARTRTPSSACAVESTSPSRWIEARTSPRSYGTSSSVTMASARRRSDAAVSRSSMPRPVTGRHGDRARVQLDQAHGLLGRQVGLVEDDQLGHSVGADLGQHGVDGVDLRHRDRARWRRRRGRAGRPRPRPRACS